MYSLAKIGADTAENERIFAEIFRRVRARSGLRCLAGWAQSQATCPPCGPAAPAEAAVTARLGLGVRGLGSAKLASFANF